MADCSWGAGSAYFLLSWIAPAKEISLCWCSAYRVVRVFFLFTLSPVQVIIALLEVIVARLGEFNRETKETNITVRIDLDGHGKAEIATGVGFLDHMLELFARHGLFDLNISCRGDLHID